MYWVEIIYIDTVNCRIGSLEIENVADGTFIAVNCRIGSLETFPHCLSTVNSVNCRIGSLEI